MSARKVGLMLCAVALSLVLSSCNVVEKSQERESIFDKVVGISKELVLDIPLLPPLCDELPGLKKGFVEVEDGKLYYEEEGAGISLVLINGGPGCTHQCFHPYFSQIKNFARIIYYDQRGTGKSSKDDTGKTYTIKQAVDDLESLRKALKIEKWAVLGWSYGGLFAQCYALTYPNRFSGLILIASHSGLYEPIMRPDLDQMFISKAEQNAIRNIEENGNLTSTQIIYNKYLVGDWKRHNYYKPRKEAFIRTALYEWSPGPGFEKLIRAEASKINLEGKFYNFEIPTLIIEAQWDLGWLNPGRAELMRRNHPQAQVEIFEKSGHQVFADEPEKFMSLLKGFLKKSSEAQIIYKPGNRLVFPSQILLLDRVKIAQSTSSKNGREQLIAACYKQAFDERSMDPEVWVRLVYDFIHAKKDYHTCLTALQRLEDSLKKFAPEQWQTYGYCIQAWKGHMLDLLGKRGEALACYHEAIKTNNGRSDNYFDDCMKINKQWLEERLTVPFTWGLFKD